MQSRHACHHQSACNEEESIYSRSSKSIIAETLDSRDVCYRLGADGRAL